MSGQVIPKGDRKWLVRWYVGKINGKRVYNSETVTGTHAQAQQALRKKLSAKDTGTLVATSKQSVKDYLTDWLKGRQTISHKTRRDYQQRLDAYPIPHLGHHRLDKLAPTHIREMVTAMDTGPRTIQYTLSVLKQALSHAVRDNLLSRNPAEFIETPSVPKRTATVLTTDEMRTLMTSPKVPAPRQVMWTVALSSGLRPQEYLALTWDDIDFALSLIHVRRALVEVAAGRWIVGETKTHGSVRAVPVPAAVMEALKAHKATQAATILARGKDYHRNNLVFATRDGFHLDLSAVRKWWKLDGRVAGVPSVRLYDSRHSHLTALLSANVHPKIAQDRAGHSSYRTTMDIYSHVLTPMASEASDTVNTLLFATPPAKQQQQQS